MIERLSLSGQTEISRLVYGMWRLTDDPYTSPARVQAKVEACLEQGITTIDQADIYGGYTAEAAFGAALRAAPHLRDKIEIVTKCDIVAPVGRHAGARVKHYDTTAAHITAALDTSLAEMGTDRVELLLIHRPDPLMDHEETGRTLDDLVASGKVRAVGVSNFTLNQWTLLQSAMSTPLATNQIEASVLHYAPFLDGDIAWMQERAVRPMAWSPLGGGRLYGPEGAEVLAVLTRIAEEQDVDTAAVAVAWLLAHPARIAPVLGTNSLSRIQAIGDAAKVSLSREDWFEILTAAQGHEVP